MCKEVVIKVWISVRNGVRIGLGLEMELEVGFRVRIKV
jgi:hypothetical protein